MHKELISTSSIAIEAPVAKIWEALVTPDIAKQYFFGAQVITDWQEGNPITFKGSYKGNCYEEKGTIIAVQPYTLLQYTHWSHFDGLPDAPENYRVWTFDLRDKGDFTQLSVAEDNIPTEKQRLRSDEFWGGVLASIKELLE